MKVIIAGSRTITDYNLICTAVVKSGFHVHITEIVSGTARGVDMLGERWATDNHIPIKRFPADWDRWGKGAGFIRNIQMADYAGVDGGLIAITTGSSGTAHMIRMSVRKGLQIYIKVVK